MLALVQKLCCPLPSSPTVHAPDSKDTKHRRQKFAVAQKHCSPGPSSPTAGSAKRKAKPDDLNLNRACRARKKKATVRKKFQGKDMPSAKKKDDGFFRLRRAFRKLKGRTVFLELFAGSRRVCKEIHRGGGCSLAVELRHGLRVNILSKRVMKFLLNAIKEGAVAGLWLGTPCSSFSLARNCGWWVSTFSAIQKP